MVAAVIITDEESPSFAGQGAGEIPVEATLRKVQQKITAYFLGKDEKVR